MQRLEVVDELRRVTQSIPPGRVLSYGGVGQRMVPRQTGRAVGRLLAIGAPEVVWWRVVRADGFLSTVHRSPLIAAEQSLKLSREGVTVVENRVPMDKFWQED
jgi:hypothetical protein